MNRRAYLTATTGVLAALAGCTTSTSEQSTTATTSATTPPTTTTTTTSAPEPTEATTTQPTSETPTTTTEHSQYGPGPSEYDRDAVKRNATTINYQGLNRDIDPWTGKAVHFKYGRIAALTEHHADDKRYYESRIRVGDEIGEAVGAIVGTYHGARTLEVEDELAVYGVVEGEGEYELGGASYTVPEITVVIADLYTAAELE